MDQLQAAQVLGVAAYTIVFVDETAEGWRVRVRGETVPRTIPADASHPSLRAAARVGEHAAEVERLNAAKAARAAADEQADDQDAVDEDPAGETAPAGKPAAPRKRGGKKAS